LLISKKKISHINIWSQYIKVVLPAPNAPVKKTINGAGISLTIPINLWGVVQYHIMMYGLFYLKFHTFYFKEAQ
jgi:hypothetical protein